MFDYDDGNLESIIEYAKRLKGGSLATMASPEIKNKKFPGGKGDWGNLLEEFYFGYQPNSNPKPDFEKVGLELKSSPIKKLKKGNKTRAKERLSLGMIDYEKIVQERFDASSFWNKNKHLLLVYYLYEKEKHFLDFDIKLVDEWKFPTKDLDIIRNDWEIITDKVKKGKAHELSEGDTCYLAASRKGSGGKKEALKKQPFNSKIGARARAYSFKAGYMTHLLASLSGGEFGEEKKTISLVKQKELEAPNQTLEKIILSRFTPYHGMEIEELASKFGLQLNKTNKAWVANLIKKILCNILEVPSLGKSEEFVKADIEVKSVRLKEESITPKEHISFPAFDYKELVETSWEESDFLGRLEKKYLFAFFQYEGNKLYLRRVSFWNMPQGDIEEAKEVWEKTVELVKKGKIFDKMVGNQRRTHFPKAKKNNVSHVRPHAKNAKDTLPLPVMEMETKKMEYTKHCFWLNNSYIASIYRDLI